MTVQIDETLPSVGFDGSDHPLSRLSAEEIRTWRAAEEVL
jgi:hypothetical protein